jgi:primosomal protein N' (replication factor Y)
VHDRPLAQVSVVDMREEYAAAGPDLVLSRRLQAALQERLDRREQSVVLLNRRGYATAVFCRQCAGTVDCPNCSVSLVVHGEGTGARRAQCHYCNYTVRVPTVCPLCAAPYLEQAGFGTERVEKEVRSVCPTARVARIDRDAIRRRGALETLLMRFRQGEIDVLVGTQMVAKGHDFPGVTLVGVISADIGLGLADFRAAERTFQLLTQVAGRAGRGDRPGEAIVQTLYPDHYSIQLACRQDYPAFYDARLRFRTSLLYPPVSRSSTPSCAAGRSRLRWTMRPRLSRGCEPRTKDAGLPRSRAGHRRRSVACEATIACSSLEGSRPATDAGGGDGGAGGENRRRAADDGRRRSAFCDGKSTSSVIVVVSL